MNSSGTSVYTEMMGLNYDLQQVWQNGPRNMRQLRIRDTLTELCKQVCHFKTNHTHPKINPKLTSKDPHSTMDHITVTRLKKVDQLVKQVWPVLRPIPLGYGRDGVCLHWRKALGLRRVEGRGYELTTAALTLLWLSPRQEGNNTLICTLD